MHWISRAVFHAVALFVLAAASDRCGFAGAACAPGCEERKLASGESYYCWLPPKFDPDTRYLLVVACHGTGVNGTTMGNLVRVIQARKLPVVVVAPNFPWRGAGLQTLGSAMFDKGMTLWEDMMDDLKGRCLLYPRSCLFGLTCGSWFAFEFTQRRPESVLACAGLSCPGTSAPRPAAKNIPFLVACGTKDEYLESAKKWYESAQSAKYTAVTCDWQDGVGNTITPRTLELTADLFVRAWEAGPGSCVQVGRATVWQQEATALEAMDERNFPLILQRLRAGAKDVKAADSAAEAGRLLKAVEQWTLKRMTTIEGLLKTSPARGMELLQKTAEVLKGDPLAETFIKREAEAAKDTELQKELVPDRQFEGLAAVYRKEAQRFRRPEDPKAVALRQQFQVALDAFIKANANTKAAARAREMKKELSDCAAKP